MIGTMTRDAALKQNLTEHRRDLRDDVRRRLHEVRAFRPRDGRDVIERADDDSLGDFDFALLQLKSERLGCMDDALARLDAGAYGCCVECGREVSERRLRVLPLAVRCQNCEGKRELVRGQARPLVRQRDDPSPTYDTDHPSNP